MLNLTEAQITAAQNNDLGAIAAIISETEGLVTEAARRHSKFAGEDNATRAEDLAQEGRIAVWRALERFEGTAVAQFAAFIRQTIEGAMSDARRAEVYAGLSASAAHDFEMAMRYAGGDPFEAEKVATRADVMGPRRMSAELANAARLSWQGLQYLDAPAGVDDQGEPVTLGAQLAEEIGLPADLVESGDIERHRRKVIRTQVHGTLGRMSERMAFVLKADHGISPVPRYGEDVPDSELAADMGVDAGQVRKVRYRAQERFSALYLAGAQQW